jgi:hypothetical protein
MAASPDGRPLPASPAWRAQTAWIWPLRERVLVPITGDDALFERSQRPTYVRVVLFR